MELFEIKAEIPSAAAEPVDTLLLETEAQGWSVLEDVIIKRAWVIGIFPSKPEAEAAWVALAPLLPTPPLSNPEIKLLADQDWKDSYKAHFKASRFAHLHWVPIWEKPSYALPEGNVALWLDPGLAFGTGNHETTRLCAERLLTWATALPAGVLPGKKVIDAGCGSGILALSAALIGCRSVFAFDNDPEAVRVSLENQTLNGMDGAVDFKTADLISGLEGRQADVVMANIQADVLMAFSDRLLAAVAPGGFLVLSGILAHENEQVRSVFAQKATGWSVEHRQMGEWSDVLLSRP